MTDEKTAGIKLSLENREFNDNHSLGELFLYFSDEMSDITWIQAFQMLLQMFRTILYDTVELSEETIDELVDAFMSAIPTVLRYRCIYKSLNKRYNEKNKKIVMKKIMR